jgi:hypothetical protein
MLTLALISFIVALDIDDVLLSIAKRFRPRCLCVVLHAFRRTKSGPAKSGLLLRVALRGSGALKEPQRHACPKENVEIEVI